MTDPLDSDEKRNAVDELFECLRTGRGLVHGDTKQGIAAAEAEWKALRVENADQAQRLRYYSEREAHFSRVLTVCDGGRYTNDWDAAIRRVVAENAAMRDELLRLRAIVCDADSESIDELIATTPTADIEQRRINAAEATRLLGLDQEPT